MGGIMAKHPSYLGGHTMTGTSVGFAGWGSKKNKKVGGPGLLGMAPAVNEAEPYSLLKPDEVYREPIPRFPINLRPKMGKKAK
jgi:hypothetical protein